MLLCVQRSYCWSCIEAGLDTASLGRPNKSALHASYSLHHTACIILVTLPPRVPEPGTVGSASEDHDGSSLHCSRHSRNLPARKQNQSHLSCYYRRACAAGWLRSIFGSAQVFRLCQRSPCVCSASIQRWNISQCQHSHMRSSQGLRDSRIVSQNLTELERASVASHHLDVARKQPHCM